MTQVVSAIFLIKRMAKGGQAPPFMFDVLWREATAEDATPASGQTTSLEIAASAGTSASTAGVEKAHVSSKLREIMQSLFGLDVAPSQPLMEAGLDSLSAAELQNAIATAFSTELPATVMFDYPTLDALAGYVTERTSLTAPRGDSRGSFRLSCGLKSSSFHHARQSALFPPPFFLKKIACWIRAF